MSGEISSWDEQHIQVHKNSRFIFIISFSKWQPPDPDGFILHSYLECIHSIAVRDAAHSALAKIKIKNKINEQNMNNKYRKLCSNYIQICRGDNCRVRECEHSINLSKFGKTRRFCCHTCLMPWTRAHTWHAGVRAKKKLMKRKYSIFNFH